MQVGLNVYRGVLRRAENFMEAPRSEGDLRAELKVYRDMLRRAEDRMEIARSEAEYEGNREIADRAFRQIEAILYKINKW